MDIAGNSTFQLRWSYAFKLTFKLQNNGFTLFLVLKPVFAEEPLDTWVIRGEEITLPCQPPLGHPEPEIEWKKNGEDVQMAPNDRSAVL